MDSLWITDNIVYNIESFRLLNWLTFYGPLRNYGLDI